MDAEKIINDFELALLDLKNPMFNDIELRTKYINSVLRESTLPKS